MFRPIVLALQHVQTWPGILFAPEWGREAPTGYAFVYKNGILRYADDNSPYITDGETMISFYQYEAQFGPVPNKNLTIVTIQGIAVTYSADSKNTYVSYPEGGYVN